MVSNSQINLVVNVAVVKRQKTSIVAKTTSLSFLAGINNAINELTAPKSHIEVIAATTRL